MWSEGEVTLSANAWAGTGTAILIARVQGRLAGSASELVHRLLNWQLRAFALNEQSIATALSAIEDLQNFEDWGTFIATIPCSMDNIDALIMPN